MRTGAAATPAGVSREESQALGGTAALLFITASWWALALWPTGGSGPEWLERTRYVCFGVSETGLPDLGGWIGLIGGPLGMLLILFVGWGAGFRGLARRARTSSRVALGMAGIVVGFVLLVGSAAMRVQTALAASPILESEDGLPPERYLRIDRPAPSLALTTQTGQPFDRIVLKGRPALVTFAFGHCQTICPLIVRDVLAAREAVLSTGIDPAVVVVTVDPWRDTASRLPAIAEEWGLPDGDAWVLSGSVGEVEAVLDAWEVPRDRDARTGNVTHPALIYVVDSDGLLAFASGGRTETLIALLRRM
jgi:protein SCO1/2